MQELSVLKEDRRPGTPLFLFECRCSPAQVFYWSSHAVTVDGCVYEARVIEHSPLEYRMATGEESAFVPRIFIRLANADQALSAMTSEGLWKGAEITIRFVVYDLESNTQSCDSVVMLKGSINAPDEVDYKTIRISVVNRLGAYRSHLPTMRVQKRCVWLFPRTAEDRAVASLSGGASRYSPFYGCGYSPDIAGGVGDVSSSGPFTTCNYTKPECMERGMYDQDSSLQATRRFAGFQFVPATRLVKGYGEKGASASVPGLIDHSGTELVPIAYGTVWTDGIVTITQSDGNLQRMEVVLCSGPIVGVIKVIVEGVEVPAGVQGQDMTPTGWYNIVSLGERLGSFNMDFRDESGIPVGDPNGGIAVLSVVVPTSIIGRGATIGVQVLLQGSLLPTYDITGVYLGDSYSSNPAWVLLDVMRRSGYREDELDLRSFAVAASICSEPIAGVDSFGNGIVTPRSDCNVLLRSKRPVAEIIRGLQLGSEISLRYNVAGKLEAFVEMGIAEQHPSLPLGSNALQQVNGGWPAYEFGDGSDGSFGVLLTPRGEPTLRLFSRSHGETANRVTIEFVDTINDYIVDTYSLVELEDVVRIGQEISAKVATVGVSGQAQAARVCRKVLSKNLEGNLYGEFETSIKAIFLRPGDIISINVPSAGMLRKLFRVNSVAPGFNGERVKIGAQVHQDEWYIGNHGDPYYPGSGCNASMVGEPRPILGDSVDGDGEPTYSIVEESVEAADGSQHVRLHVGFVVPESGFGSLETRPLVSLIPQILPSGGSLGGPQNLYYAVTEVGPAGRESQVSSTVHAFLPPGSSTSCVRLSDIRMSPNGVSLNIYRGQNPWQLRRIASEVPVGSAFTDVGLQRLPLGPPDPNFVRARFEWRSEYLPPLTVSSADQSSVAVAGVTLSPDSLKSKIVRIQGGAGQGQERVILGNTENVIAVAAQWNATPDASSTICIVESGWRYGGESTTSPVTFEVPNNSGSVIHIRGYGVNGAGVQSRREVSEIARYVVGGARGSTQDIDVPAVPSFGMSTQGGGFLEVGGIGFSDQTNLSTISSGTLQVHYLDELNLTSMSSVAEDMTSITEVLRTSTVVSLGAGTILRVGSELMRVVNAISSSSECGVERGIYGTSVSAHISGVQIHKLERKLSTLPIPKQFFGSPGSGDFSYSIPMANCRVVAADLLFTNSKGNSEAGQLNFCSLADGGLRVLSGGQISIQVGGYLAIQTAVAPPIVVEEHRAIRDIFAIVKEPPVGAPIILRLKQGTEEMCLLTIGAGCTTSNVISGMNVAPLLAMQQVSLDIVSVGQGASTLPGRDLTVTIRL